MMIFFIALFLFATTVTNLASDFPSCGDCWCIPSNNGSAPCPKWQPQTSFDPTAIDRYKEQVPTSIYSLFCNPYKNTTCVTDPPQIMVESSDAVCGYLFPDPSSCESYSMKTFPNRWELEYSGAVLTHAGSCGLCSTAQDLAIYLAEDFTTSGKQCATIGLLKGEDAGLDCYMSLGLTKECAKIWNYDGIYDGIACATACVGELTSPNNGPPPSCTLNPCLQCDEEKAGPIFSSYAGRTRRRSGLRSEIVRDCSSIFRILHHDPCANPACQCSTNTLTKVF